MVCIISASTSQCAQKTTHANVVRLPRGALACGVYRSPSLPPLSGCHVCVLHGGDLLLHSALKGLLGSHECRAAGLNAHLLQDLAQGRPDGLDKEGEAPPALLHLHLALPCNVARPGRVGRTVGLPVRDVRHKLERRIDAL
eukprot:2471415-Prymnesium_polylepis.1